MPLEDKTNTEKPTKKENFFVGLVKDAFRKKDDPNYGRNYGFGILKLLALSGVILGVCYCNETAHMKKANELPTKIIRLGDLPIDEQSIADALRRYVPDEGIRTYTRGRVKILKDNTIEIPYQPDK